MGRSHKAQPPKWVQISAGKKNGLILQLLFRPLYVILGKTGRRRDRGDGAAEKWVQQGLAVLTLLAVLEICRGAAASAAAPRSVLPVGRPTVFYHSLPPKEKARTDARALSFGHFRESFRAAAAVLDRYHPFLRVTGRGGIQRFHVDPFQTKGSDHVRVDRYALKINVEVISKFELYRSAFR